MREFRKRILVCLIPCLIAAWFVGFAYYRYVHGEGGFKLGVDLVGGTILVYEIDIDKFPDGKLPEGFTAEALAASIKRRIDPTDIRNIVVRPVSKTRVEIILPTGGKHQADAQERQWQELLEAARQKWPEALQDKPLTAPRGETSTLRVQLEGYKVDAPEKIDEFIKSQWSSGQKRDFSTEEVQAIKALIAKVGSLEFRIVASLPDDSDAFTAAKGNFTPLTDPKGDDKEKATRQAELDSLATRGLPPTAPKPPDPEGFRYKTDKTSGNALYSWVELGRQQRKQLHLDNASQKDLGSNWQRAAAARGTEKDPRQQAVEIQSSGGGTTWLLWSRPTVNRNLKHEEQQDKKFDYFVLVREPGAAQRVTGQDLVNSYAGSDDKGKTAVHFRLSGNGGNRFYALSSANIKRHLAVVLEGMIESAPVLQSAIRHEGQITGDFTPKEINDLVRVLRSGALPATLKRIPVSENTIGPTLGADTIAQGTTSVGLAFLAVLVFMAVYYRFAGLVACVALLANLLLAIGFMVAVNATFTLPGLAGLVLMLSLAVDANVLIYERLREERERGNSILMALRNGYDRAFPTIIDTHLTSILTAVILYAVGNDQLKGFGVSLTVGLLISLFTSLYMTRLIFDIWAAKGWLTDLSMFKLLSKTSIDFMAIRNYWFTATVLLTLFGITVFLVRGERGLNIDFVGGTAFTGQLNKDSALNSAQLRALLGEENQANQLKVADVKQIDTAGRSFLVTYEDKTSQSVRLPNPAAGATTEERQEDIRLRAKHLPDWSVEQIFLSSESHPEGGSRFFTVRTSEKAPDLVQVTINRLVPNLLNINWLSTRIDGPRTAILQFSENASPAYIKLLIENQIEDSQLLKQAGLPEDQRYELPQPVDVIGGTLDKDGKFQAGQGGEQGRYKDMRVELTDQAAGKIAGDELKSDLDKAKKAFEARPPAERLEIFDSALAADTRTRALYAILGSWLVILGYLWFRFGSWTFGLAAVLCLMHDLLFTLGIIAFCHYIFTGVPGLAHLLLIQDFKIDLPSVAALLTLVGYSVNDTIVVFDRIREIRGKNPELTPQMINDSVNQTLSRTLLTSFITWLTVFVLYVWGGEGVHLFAFVMVVGVVVGTYSSIYIASPLLLIFGEGQTEASRARRPEPEKEPEPEEEEEGEKEAAPA